MSCLSKKYFLSEFVIGTAHQQLGADRNDDFLT